MNLSSLKASEKDIERLALLETNRALAQKFEPICLGVLFALLALTIIGIASLPFMIFRLFKNE
jgi:hypothetical protein